MNFFRRLVSGSGGARLTCAHTAPSKDKPGLLIALPFGVPAGVAGAAFEKFGPAFNVVTWESRYVLALDQAFAGDEKMGPAEHVEDMLCVLRALEIGTCRLVGYCSGAGVSLLAARQHPAVFVELILVSGEYQLFRQQGHAATDYQRSIDTFLPAVARGRPQAAFIFTRMAELSKLSKGGLQSELDKQINAPFDQEERLFRYAKNYMAYRDFDALGVARGVRQRTLVLAGRRDQHANLENSAAVGGAIAGASTIVDDEGDHYEFCRAGSKMLDQIGAHLAG